jgi:hypothetical protein
MVAQNELHNALRRPSLGRSALRGAGLALLLATIFLCVIFLIGDVLAGKKFWQGVWEFFPLITVTGGGALGGTFYYLLIQAWQPEGWKKIVAAVVSALAYIALLWLSLIARFSATGQWD